MSTKTLRKRIALVAVATLGAGVLSVAPAFAAAGSIALTAPSTSVAGSGICANAAGGAAVTTPNVIAVGGTQTVTYTQEVTSGGKAIYAVIDGPAKWASTAAGAIQSDMVTIYKATELAAAASVLQVTGPGAIRVYLLTAAGGTPFGAKYILGVPSCTSGTSAAKSFLQVVDDSANILTAAQWTAGTASGSGTANAANAMDTSNDEKTTFENADTAYIAINTNDAYGVANTTSKAIVVSCTNNAKVGGNAGGFYTVSDTAAFKQISVAQGTANAPLDTVCTVSADSTVLGTKSIKFLGTMTSIVLSQSSSGNYDTSTKGVIKYYLKDSAGNSLPQASDPSLTSATASKVTNALSALTSGDINAYGAMATSSQYSYGKLAFNCLDYGDTSISVYSVNDLGAVITSNVVAVHCGGDAWTYTASLDKAAYKTGDIATLTITIKDYNGGLAGSDVTLNAGFSAALSGMTAVVAPVTTDAASDINGTWTYQYAVGQSTGAFTGSVKVAVPSTAPQYGKAVSLQYTIASSDGGVSNADVLKAIVSLIASINKQIAALQKALLKK